LRTDALVRSLREIVSSQQPDALLEATTPRVEKAR
jgi:hypothetical protein